MGVITFIRMDVFGIFGNFEGDKNDRNKSKIYCSGSNKQPTESQTYFTEV